MADLLTPTNDAQFEQTAESLITMTAKDGGNVDHAGAIIDHIDIWTTAIEQKSSAGRGSSNKFSLYGIKKLRELILELAVRGKLVPQDPNDEPASVLLERIAAEKAQLVKEEKLKKQKPLPEISEDEKPFELPKGWEWSKLGSLSSDIHYGYTASAKHNSEGVRLLRITDIQNDKVNWSTVPACDISPEKSKSYLLENDDILLARTGGTIGKSYLVENINVEAVFASYLIRVRRIGSMYASYIKVYLGSQLYWVQLYNNAAGTGQPNVNATALKSLLFPIPPLEEQHRIVAKVDELMSLCDALEAQTEASISAHQTLVETLLNALLLPLPQATSQSDVSLEPQPFTDSFDKDWQRVADHFDTLFTTAASIDTLKQTILQLAVMGKLVKQNPNDEPAAKLLERIAKEKAQLIKEGKIKKQKLLPAITHEEKPFELPQGWEFTRLENIAELITKGSSPKWQGVIYTENESDVLFVTSENVGAFKLLLENKKYVELKFNEIEPRSILAYGDFLMNIVGGSIGRTAIFNIDALANINQAVCLIRCLADLSSSKYLLNFFNSSLCISYMMDKQVDNARANLSMGNISKFVMPIPPLEEQHRIVAKVDELMALCDQLKARLADAQTTQLHLTDAIVEQAV
ncbi:Type I restriction enzyme EcoKI specificity protein [Shewanella baltica]|uniref:restriction endonuclease subunit S n=1 Tax=Shewanella baltica TaxID=62322 RepID=UPI000F71F2C3|nr:restriction endonuclease subunit S [Shewanella baltica]VEF25101.1 Type I restriction enzyme EcoKI specificity protein [Shewanella baltica]